MKEKKEDGKTSKKKKRPLDLLFVLSFYPAPHHPDLQDHDARPRTCTGVTH
jgi:hypothetical protein